MCYHCATNPSIHHHRYCVMAVLSPLSHHGVAFTVTSSQFHHCCHSVTFMLVTVLPLCWLQFCHCHHGVEMDKGDVPIQKEYISKKKLILFLLIPFLPPK